MQKLTAFSFILLVLTSFVNAQESSTTFKIYYNFSKTVFIIYFNKVDLSKIISSFSIRDYKTMPITTHCHLQKLFNLRSGLRI